MISELLENHLLKKNIEEEVSSFTKFEKTDLIKNYDKKEKQNDGENKNFFKTQFHLIYANRLKNLKRIYQSNFPDKKFGTIKDLSHSQSKSKIYVVGIIKKNMKKFHSYLKTIEEPEFHDFNVKSHERYYSKDDEIFFEDESGKILLKQRSEFKHNQINLHNFNLTSLTTGCVICLTGFIDEKNILQTNEILFFDHSNEKTKKEDRMIEEGIELDYTLLVSGLNLDPEKINSPKFELLKQFLLNNNSEYSRNISNLIMFSGSCACLEDKNLIQYGSYLFKNEYEIVKNDSTTVFKILDVLLSNFLKSPQKVYNRSVFIMPGLNDITSSLLPQNPFNRIFFPELSNYSHSFFLKNPDIIKLNNNKLVLFLDGKIIEDYQNQSNLEFVEIVKLFLSMKLLCPTAPNTLETYPFIDEDPLTLEHFPDYVIVGGAEEFHKDFFYLKNDHSIQLIFIPSFDSKNQIVLYDFNNDRFNIVDFQ